MALIEGTIFCDNCGIEISWAPIMVQKFHYCCRECFNYYPCECGDRTDMEEERRQQPIVPGIPENVAFP